MGEVHGDFIGVEEDESVHEWEAGLPNVEDITPLTQGLIPSELLSAFNISPEPYRSSGDVIQASEDTVTSLRGSIFKDFAGEVDDDDGERSETKKQRRDEKALKRSRLVWTPQLHKRFVDVVDHLGLKSAVPKTIMQLMNVEGLTRENVASHLQKYRLFLRRMQGVSFDGPSNSPAASSENGSLPENGGMSIPMMPMTMPMMGMGMGMGMGMVNYHHNNPYNHHNHQYSNGMMMQSGNKYGSALTYHYPHFD